MAMRLLQSYRQLRRAQSMLTSKIQTTVATVCSRGDWNKEKWYWWDDTDWFGGTFFYFLWIVQTVPVGFGVGTGAGFGARAGAGFGFGVGAGAWAGFGTRAGAGFGAGGRLELGGVSFMTLKNSTSWEGTSASTLLASASLGAWGRKGVVRKYNSVWKQWETMRQYRAQVIISEASTTQHKKKPDERRPGLNFSFDFN